MISTLKFSKIFLVLFLFVNFFTNCTIISLNKWSRDGKSVLILGDSVPVYDLSDSLTHNLSDPLRQLDHEHSRIILSACATLELKSLANANKKIKFLIDDVSEDIREFIDSPSRIKYIAMRHSLAAFACDANTNGVIDFELFDMRTRDLRIPNQFFLNCYQHVKANLGYDLDDSTDDFLYKNITEIHKILKKNKIHLTYNCKNLTISEYLEYLQKIAIKCKEFDPENSESIVSFIKAAEVIFKENARYLEQSVSDCLTNMLFQKGFVDFKKLLAPIFGKMSIYLLNLSAKIALQSALQSYDLVILFVGDHTTGVLNELLVKNGFTQELYYGPKEGLNLVSQQPICCKKLEVILNNFIKKAGPRHKCHNCSNLEVDDIHYKKCSSCKTVYYCSVDCQKKNWKKHKKDCKHKDHKNNSLKNSIKEARQKQECHNCKKIESDIEHKKCARCRTVYYCSVDCQKNDWKEHSILCKK